MVDNTDIEVLKAHRARVATVTNFQEFQEAQLDLLDYMIASAEATNAFAAKLAGEDLRDAFRDFQDKFDKWASS